MCRLGCAGDPDPYRGLSPTTGLAVPIEKHPEPKPAPASPVEGTKEIPKCLPSPRRSPRPRRIR